LSLPCPSVKGCPCRQILVPSSCRPFALLRRQPLVLVEKHSLQAIQLAQIGVNVKARQARSSRNKALQACASFERRCNAEGSYLKALFCLLLKSHKRTTIEGLVYPAARDQSNPMKSPCRRASHLPEPQTSKLASEHCRTGICLPFALCPDGIGRVQLRCYHIR
jgi:hypothetical protein